MSATPIYIGATHVEAYNPLRRPFGPGTKPNDVELSELIAHAEADVTGVLVQAGISVPIASSATGMGRKLVESACAKCAAALVEQVAPNADPKRIDHYVKMCNEAKAAIEAGGLAGFDDIDLSSDGSGGVRHGFGEATPPFFTRDMVL